VYLHEPFSAPRQIVRLTSEAAALRSQLAHAEATADQWRRDCARLTLENQVPYIATVKVLFLCRTRRGLVIRSTIRESFSSSIIAFAFLFGLDWNFFGH